MNATQTHSKHIKNHAFELNTVLVANKNNMLAQAQAIADFMKAVEGEANRQVLDVILRACTEHDCFDSMNVGLALWINDADFSSFRDKCLNHYKL
jgi:hypothetical protein